MKKIFSSVSLLLLVSLITASASSGVEFTRGASGEPYSQEGLAVSVRLIGGEGEILLPGKNIGLSFKANRNSYVIIYNIDSEGFINLLYPSDGKLRVAEEDKVYTVPERGSDLRLKAGGKTGIEYIHAIAVEDRGSIDDQELYFLSQNYQLPREKRFRTDLDPYLAFNMIDESVVEDIEEAGMATDHTYFFVNRMVEYPSYLCSECHGADKFTDPYAEQCPQISIQKNYYDTHPEYPYPPLYNIVHTDGLPDDEYYSSAAGGDDYYSSTTYYEDNLSNDWDDELYETDEDDIHLSISYWNHGWYPYSGYLYPYSGFGRSYWYPSYHYTDSFYWGFGIGWGNWSYYNWYDYYYPYYAWHLPYNYWYRDYPWRDHHYRSRSLYAGRNFRRRNLNYYATLSRNRKEKSLRGSRLARKRLASSIERRSEASRLSRSLSTRGSRTAAEYVRKRPSNTRSRYNPRTRVIYGERRGSPVRKGSNRATGAVDRTRRTGRDSRTVYQRDGKYQRRTDNRSAVRNRKSPDRTTPRRTTRESKSRPVTRSRRDDSGNRSTRGTRSTRRRESSTDKNSRTTRSRRSSKSSSARSSRRSSRSSAERSSRTTRSRGNSGRGRSSRSSGGSSRSSSRGSSSRSSGGRGRH